MDPGARKLVNGLIAHAMPKVAAMVREKRALWGDRHVTECVARGLAGERGWFFAREGSVAIGVPWGADADLLTLFEVHMATGGAFVLMKEPTHGAHS